MEVFFLQYKLRPDLQLTFFHDAAAVQAKRPEMIRLLKVLA